MYVFPALRWKELRSAVGGAALLQLDASNAMLLTAQPLPQVM